MARSWGRSISDGRAAFFAILTKYRLTRPFPCLSIESAWDNIATTLLGDEMKLFFAGSLTLLIGAVALWPRPEQLPPLHYHEQTSTDSVNISEYMATIERMMTGTKEENERL